MTQNKNSKLKNNCLDCDIPEDIKAQVTAKTKSVVERILKVVLLKLLL